MKKLLIILFLCFTVNSFAQEKEEKNRTEIKFNLFSIARQSIDFEFERTLNNYSSVGMSFRQSYSVGHSSDIAAFYRYYLGKKYASGFFIEGFGMYQSNKELVNKTFSFGSLNVLELKSDFALGVGIGYKWVSKNGLILQANLGAGRNLINGKNSYGELHPGKAGLSIGYRF